MEKPITEKLQKLLTSTTKTLETFENAENPASLLTELVRAYKTCVAQTKEYGCDHKKLIMNQLKFSLNCLSGLVEACKRQQDMPVKVHLENIRSGLERVITEIRQSEKPAVQPTEKLGGGDWLSTLQNIRNKMLSQEKEQQQQTEPDTTLNPTDVQVVQNLGSVDVTLLGDEPYGMITAPILIAKGRFDRAAKSVLASENYSVKEFLESYYAIDNAKVLGVSANMHTATFVNEALRFVNQHYDDSFDLCGNGYRVESHFYYVLMPKRLVQNKNVTINQWTFQKK